MRRRLRNDFLLRLTMNSLWICCLLLAACEDIESISHAELAYLHAPVHYQDTDGSRYQADFITSFDYDGDTNTRNNWDHLDQFPLAAKVHYSVVETPSHWFILYAFYHPRDWSERGGNEHENDLEGALAAVRKDGSRTGDLEGIVTIQHNRFYSYVPDGGSLSAGGGQGIDGNLNFEVSAGSYRPITQQEARGHALAAFDHIGDFAGKPGRMESYTGRAVPHRTSLPRAPGLRPTLWPTFSRRKGSGTSK